MNNDRDYKDRGIEQTWKFAHPNNKKVTGPLNNFKKAFKRILKGSSRVSPRTFVVRKIVRKLSEKTGQNIPENLI